MKTRFQVREIPVGAAIQLSRRLLAMPDMVTIRSVHELMAEWWDDSAPQLEHHLSGAAALVTGAGSLGHPFEYAVMVLESRAQGHAR